MKITDMFSLDGKKALVTGCTRGIGKAITLALAEAGADIVGVSGSIETTGGALAAAVEASGRRFYPYRADLGNRGALYDFTHAVKATHPRIDILVNNAGIIRREPAGTHPDSYWDEVTGLNLDAPFILTREFGSEMVRRGSGKIIFVCSLLSFQGGVFVPGYTASKSAVAGLVRAFANEWAANGVHVNGIAPGYVDTDNTEALRSDPARSRAILERIPAGRWGKPDDFRGPAVFLASAASAYVHGAILTVDGGWMGR